MQISDPYQPVTLDAIPDILLHIEVDGIRAGLPDPVQKRVAARKAPEIRNIAVQKDRLCRAELHAGSRRQQIDSDKTEAGLADRRHAELPDGNRPVTAGVIVCCAAGPVQLAHCLRCGFAEPDAQPHIFSTAQRTHAEHQSARELLSIVQQNGGGSNAVCERAAVGIVKPDLHRAVFQQRFTAGNAAGFPYHRCGRQIDAAALVRFCAGRKSLFLQKGGFLFLNHIVLLCYPLTAPATMPSR